MPPDPRKWRITAPRAGTLDSLVLTFPKPLDYALLQHEIVAREEKEWRFIPDMPWSSREYRVAIRTTMEDIAGNHVDRPFDVDTFDPITTSVASEVVLLKMRPR